MPRRSILTPILALLIVAGHTVIGRAPSNGPAEISTSGYVGSPRLTDRLEPTPLFFEENRGQHDPSVAYVARLGGSTVLLTAADAVFVLPDATGEARSLRMRWAAAQPRPRIRGRGRLGSSSNYMIGSDPSRWQTRVPHYAEVRYEGVYPGVDIRFYENAGQLEYDFEVAPGVDPNQILLAYNGADDITIDGTGSLVMAVADTEIVQTAPVAYQEIDGTRTAVAASFELQQTSEGPEARFALGPYDPAHRLVIDPRIGFSTHLGGSTGEYAEDIARNSKNGDLYVVGWGSSADLPLAGSQPIKTGVFVARYNKRGKLTAATYISGKSHDFGRGIAVSSTASFRRPGGRGVAAGAVYITGDVSSTNFPTRNPTQKKKGGGSSDAFVTVLSLDLEDLLFSTYMGGRDIDRGHAIAVDDAGYAYVTGTSASSDFDHVNGVQQELAGFESIIVAVIDPGVATGARVRRAAPAVRFQDLLGGDRSPIGTGPQGLAQQSPSGIAVWTPASESSGDGSRYLVVAGDTNANGFPTVQPVQDDRQGHYDHFLTVYDLSELPADAPEVVFSTYWGGTGEDRAGGGLSVDPDGIACTDGWSVSDDYPMVTATQANRSGTGDATVWCIDLAPLAAGGDPPVSVFSTYFGGSGADFGTGIAWDTKGTLHLVGGTRGDDIPTVKPVQAASNGSDEGFVVRFAGIRGAGRTARAPSIAFATYFGGSDLDQINGVATDHKGATYFTGGTNSTDFPLKKATQSTYGGAFVSNIKK